MDKLFDFQANLTKVDIKVLKHVGCDTGAFFDQAQQHVFGADVFVVETLCLLVGKLHDLAGTVCKAFVHFSPCRSGNDSNNVCENEVGERYLDQVWFWLYQVSIFFTRFKQIGSA